MKKDIFLKLRETIEHDLKETGFHPASAPPCREPSLGGPVADRSDRELKGLYDEFLAFYEYLTDNIVRCLGFVSVAKARVDLKKAEGLLAARKDDSLTNAELRSSYIMTEPGYLSAYRDYIYFKTMMSMHEERRKKISKTMDRLGRELWLRTQKEPTHEFTKPEAKSSRYKPVLPDFVRNSED